MHSSNPSFLLMAVDKARSRRYGEPAKFVPVIFVVGVIATVYGIYTYVDTSPNRRDMSLFNRGVVELVVFNVLAFMLLLCLVLAVITPPGGIPNDSEWTYVGDSVKSEQPVEVQTALETKKSGDRRFCKWSCSKYKPDRAHHCRVCDSCILRMDHHCPWIYNCVGFRNHKYFFLLLFYSSLTSLMVTVTMAWSVRDIVMEEDPTMSELFLVLFGETLSGFLALIVTGFFLFHIFLAIKGLTTIEFCEKQRSKSYESIFSKGVYGNFKDILGKNPLLWVLPIPPANGDGLSFEVDLTKFSPNDSALISARGYVGQRDDDGGTGGGGIMHNNESEHSPLIKG